MNAALVPIGDQPVVQPEIDRSVRSVDKQAAYRRLAIAILGLDPETLSRELRAARLAQRRPARRRTDLERAA